MMRWMCSIVVAIISLHTCIAQIHQRSFIAPLNIPLRLSGSFGELRSDHFHSGIDLKTYGREGLPVFAVNDGYIYRVKVSPFGYGKALYILHDNGTLSVYGHLSAFNGPIRDTVESIQYRNKKFDLEYYPDSLQYHVSKGDTIAFSGNSGGSEAPHLHFEIRDQSTEEPLNPLLYEWFAEDTIVPRIRKVHIYNFHHGVFDHLLESNTSVQTIYASSDTLAIGVEADDFSNESNSDIGIYSAVLIADSDTVFNVAFNRMNFDQTRYANATMDYEWKKITGKTVFRLHKLPGNRSAIFNNSGNGLMLFDADSTKNCRIILTDVNGNRSVSDFTVVRPGRSKNAVAPEIIYPSARIIKKWKKAEIEFPDNSFYQSVDAPDLTYLKRKEEFPVVMVKPLFRCYSRQFLVKFKVDKTDPLLKKYTGVVVDEELKPLQPATTLSGENYIIVKSIKGGFFSVVADTTAPVIGNIEFVADSLSGSRFLYIDVADPLSGLENYSVNIDGVWSLFEYDAKNNRITADAEKLPFQFTADIKAEDKCSNVVIKRVTLINPYSSNRLNNNQPKE